jgi:hypothetical protein
LDNPRFGVKDWDDAKQARVPCPANGASEVPQFGQSKCFWVTFGDSFDIFPKQLPLHSPLSSSDSDNPTTGAFLTSAGEATRVQLWTTRFRCHRDCETGALGAMDFIGVMVTYCFMLVRLVLKPVTIKDIKDWLVSHISEFSFLWDFSMTFSFFKGVSFTTNRSPAGCRKANTKVLDTLKVTDIAMQIYETSKQAVSWPFVCHRLRIGSPFPVIG